MLRLIIILLLAFSTNLKAASSVFEVKPEHTLLIQGPIRDLKKEIFDLALIGLTGPKSIYLMIDSPGGSLDAGEEFMSAMAKIQARGIKFECFAKKAQSMGLVIFNACDRRVVMADSQLLWHPARASGMGSLTPDEAEELAKGLREADSRIWNEVRAKLKVSDEVWKHHYYRETNHTGKEFHDLAPHYTEMVDEIKNFEFRIFDPLDELLKQLFPEGKLIVPAMPIQ